jgi:ATP-dependent Lon protease
MEGLTAGLAPALPPARPDCLTHSRASLTALLAAQVPHRNVAEVEFELPENVRTALTVTGVRTMRDVLRCAFPDQPSFNLPEPIAASL